MSVARTCPGRLDPRSPSLLPSAGGGQSGSGFTSSLDRPRGGTMRSLKDAPPDGHDPWPRTSIGPSICWLSSPSRTTLRSPVALHRRSPSAPNSIAPEAVCPAPRSGWIGRCVSHRDSGPTSCLRRVADAPPRLPAARRPDHAALASGGLSRAARGTFNSANDADFCRECPPACLRPSHHHGDGTSLRCLRERHHRTLSQPKHRQGTWPCHPAPQADWRL